MLFIRNRVQLSLSVSFFLLSNHALLAGVIPPNIVSSNLTLRIEYVGQMPSSKNPVSPQSTASGLLFIDQGGSLFFRNSSGNFSTVLNRSDAPVGLTLDGSIGILNAAVNSTNNEAIVVFTSTTVPSGVSVVPSTRMNANAYQVVYAYDFDGNDGFSNPQPIVAYEVFTGGRHTGGGLTALPDEQGYLFVTGDNGNFNQDGDAFPQDDSSHIGKVIKIDSATNTWEVVAKGVRNPQKLVITTIEGEHYLSFTDIGGNIAEELNLINIDTLLNTNIIENFGWGRNASDTLAREGTFYIDSSGDFAGMAPTPELGFIQPLAQWGREDASFVAATGPLSNSTSLENIGFLFGDLVSGEVYATTELSTDILQSVYEVNLIDSSNQATSLNTLAGGRADPRFFKFEDGSAGVLLERTGDFYSLTEIAELSVPEPKSFLLAILSSAIALLSVTVARYRMSAT